MSKIKQFWRWLMSLYLGDNNSGTAILHMTKVEESEASMKAGKLPSTFFHSDLNNLSVKEFAFESIIVEGTVRYLKVSDAFLAYVSTNKNGFFVTYKDWLVTTSNPVAILTFADGLNPPFIFHDTYLNGVTHTYSDYPLSTHRYTLLNLGYYGYENGLAEQTTAVLSDFKIYVLNLNADGFFQTTGNNEVLISNTELVVNSVDLAAFDYISNAKLNIIDKQFMLYSAPMDAPSNYFGYLYESGLASALIEPSKNTSAGMEFTATYIKKGPYLIFDKSASASGIQYSSLYNKVLPYVPRIKGIDYLICDYTFYIGQMFVISRFSSFVKGSVVNRMFFPLVYKEGDICTFGQVREDSTFDFATTFVNLKGVDGKLYIYLTNTIADRALEFNVNIMVFS